MLPSLPSTFPLSSLLPPDVRADAQRLAARGTAGLEDRRARPGEDHDRRVLTGSVASLSPSMAAVAALMSCDTATARAFVASHGGADPEVLQTGLSSSRTRNGPFPT